MAWGILLLSRLVIESEVGLLNTGLSVTKIMRSTIMTLVTPKVGAKHELLISKPVLTRRLAESVVSRQV